MRKTNISDVEKPVLQHYAKASPLVLIRFKAQAILMASNQIPATVIGDILDRSERIIILWLRDWNRRRLASLFTGHQDNVNAAKLTKEQLAQIKVTLASPPSDTGITGSFWDVPKLKTYIETSFGVVYESDQSYHFLLKFSNLSFKYPDTFDRKRNIAAIEARMREIHAEVAPLLVSPGWEVFAVDEVRMEQEAITRRAWLKRGERTVIRVNRDKQFQSYIGFLSQKTFRCEVYEMAWQNQAEVLKAFEQFLAAHPGKNIAIVWDNAAFHKGREIRAALAKGRLLERVHLVPMPPYAPDHNPIEHVWNTAKQAVANIQHRTFEQTKTAFASYVAGRKFKYAL
jgi:transposase